MNNSAANKKEAADVEQEVLQKDACRVDSAEDEKYDRFSPKSKSFFVFLVAVSCLLSPLSSLAFLPAVQEIADRFHTTGSIINVSNAVYCVIMAVSPCIMGPFGDIYGRRVIFVLCLFLFSATTLIVGFSPNLATFYVFRSLSAFFGTAFFATGAAIVGDIYPPVQRGKAMGWILSGSQLGPAFGPCVGGIIVNYTTWRAIFWLLAGIGFATFVMVAIWLPETGINLKHEQLKLETGKRFVWVPINPLRVILSLKYPTLILIGTVSVSIHYNMYALLTPIRYVINPRYKLEEPIYAGLFYLAPGSGYLAGSFIGGRLADRVVHRYIRLKGKRVPEDRLRSAVVAHGIVLPGAMLVYGWTLKFKKGGIPLTVISMFLSGLAQTVSFPSINAYCVDSMPELKGAAISGNYMIRFVAAAVATATVLIQIQSIGIGWSCTISALLLMVGGAASVLLIRYGEQLRQYQAARFPVDSL